MSLILDIKFAFTKSVPELDCPVPATRDDLTIISTEADRKDIRGVADESTGGKTGVQVPETEGVIPGRREGELTIRRNDNIGNEVVVDMENSLGVAVRVLIASQLPDDDGFIYR